MLFSNKSFYFICEKVFPPPSIRRKLLTYISFSMQKVVNLSLKNKNKKSSQVKNYISP